MKMTCVLTRYTDPTFCLNCIGCFFHYQLASARAPLQAKIEDMEDAMQNLQDKLNKVKADNDRVSYLFNLKASRQTKVIGRDYVPKTTGSNIKRNSTI